MSADLLIESLMAIHPKGFDLSLERIARLLKRLGNPQDKLPPVIHVAGTNGKGSTIAFCRSILEAAGYRVHVHTSPHLVRWHERFRIGQEGGGKFVNDAQLEAAIQRVADANNNQPITVFEILSAAMFLLFSETPADFALIEVGLGGRFDATNVISSPAICAISSISVDHESYLGNKISGIAFEKGGIIKTGVPVVIGPQAGDVRTVLEEIANQRQAPVTIAGQDFDFHAAETGFVFQDGDGLLDLPMPALAGQHQLENAALAIAIIRKLCPDISPEAISRGMRQVYWPGRLQKLQKGKIHNRLNGHQNIWIDGGHNPSAGKAIAKALSGMGGRVDTLLVCGMINTKDSEGYFAPFCDVGARVLCAPISMSEAGIDPRKLAKSARRAGLEATGFKTLEEALEKLVLECKSNPQVRVFFCGSLYFVGEILALNETLPV